MATTISNPASFSSVRSAFNAEGYGISSSFFAYRQGGGIVPATSAFNVIGAGTSGDPLQLSQFSGFTVPSPVTISITDQIIDGFGSGEAYAYYFLSSGGQALKSTEAEGINPTNIEQWCTPITESSNYEARATVTNGSLSGGDATGTWLALSSTRNWFRNSSGSGNSDTCTIFVEIRRIGTSTVLDSASIVLNTSAF